MRRAHEGFDFRRADYPRDSGVVWILGRGLIGRAEAFDVNQDRGSVRGHILQLSLLTVRLNSNGFCLIIFLNWPDVYLRLHHVQAAALHVARFP